MLRLTPEAYASLQNKISGQRKETAKPKPRARRNKYGAEPCEIDGMRFDSKAEGQRYMVLKDQCRRGEISDLECQVSFDLLPEQIIAGHKERPVRYVADFRYNRNGKPVVEDVKSGPTKTREFIIKKKLMMFIHGIHVIEVMAE
jgi:hypothetical protein